MTPACSTLHLQEKAGEKTPNPQTKSSPPAAGKTRDEEHTQCQGVWLGWDQGTEGVPSDPPSPEQPRDVFGSKTVPSSQGHGFGGTLAGMRLVVDVGREQGDPPVLRGLEEEQPR